MRKFKNPIIPGFYPDPSICRKGDDYFLVTSTMEFFPGVPVFHSMDLVHWEKIGHVLDNPYIFDLADCEASGGIMAPTIRYYNDVFYVTCGYEGKNFVCITKNPWNGWGSPVYLKGTKSIDNSLFFDEDGTCYYHENCKNPDGERFYGDRVIWAQEFDYKNLKLVGEQKIIFTGDGGGFCEAPHIYKKDGWYYLLCSEDGTYRNHSVICARATNVWGPYRSSPRNPVLTNRHLSREYPIQNIGHLDMIETQSGEWWAVALGSRPYGGFDDTQEGESNGGYFRNLGRETFLLPMKWEREWPVFSPETGKVEEEYIRPALKEFRVEVDCNHDSFDDKTLGLEWNFLRSPKEKWYSLEERSGYLRIKLRPETIEEKVNPSFIGKRQINFNFTIETSMDFLTHKEHEEAGLILLHNRFAYITFLVGMKHGKYEIKVISCYKDTKIVLGCQALASGKARAKVSTVGHNANFYVKEDMDDNYKIVAMNVSTCKLNSDETCSHTGTYIGMYATSNGKKSDNYVDFDYFSYTGNDDQCTSAHVL